MTIQEIYDEFLEAERKARLSIVEASKIDSSKSEASALAKELIINSAFINLITSWEKFLENSVIAYCLNEISLQGNIPPHYISPTNEEHANNIIKGEPLYFDWSKSDNIKNMAQRIFENGEPYISVLSGINTILIEIKKVRNNIAHNSLKSNDEFDTLIRNVLSPSDVGLTTAQFLLSQKGSQPIFWDMYFTYLKNAVMRIANF